MIFIAWIMDIFLYTNGLFFDREDNPARMLFIQHLVDDRTEGSHSYVEFLQYLKTQVK